MTVLTGFPKPGRSTALPKVTIGIPFYNNVATLGDAIRSVFHQSVSDFELILADDGSTDGSLDVARAVRDPRVRVICDGTNRGISYRLNQIAAHARAPYIARMDGDDLMHPDRIARQIDFLERHLGIDIVGTGIYTIDAVNQPVGIRGCEELQLSGPAILERALYEHPTVMARAEWFRRNPYNQHYDRAEDYELWCRIVAEGTTRCGKLKEPLFFFREHGSVRLDKCLRSYRSLWHIFRTWGPTLAGPWHTARALARVRLKGWIWRLAAATDRQAWIIARRNRALSTDEASQAQAVIDAIMATHVPGLDAEVTAA